MKITSFETKKYPANIDIFLHAGEESHCMHVDTDGVRYAAEEAAEYISGNLPEGWEIDKETLQEAAEKIAWYTEA